MLIDFTISGAPDGGRHPRQRHRDNTSNTSCMSRGRQPIHPDPTSECMRSGRVVPPQVPNDLWGMTE